MIRIRGHAIHYMLTPARIMDACMRRMLTLDNPGFCILCGAEADGCEPDARRMECESCGTRTVYESNELLMMVA